MATATTSRPQNSKQRSTLPNKPPQPGLETNKQSRHQTQGDSVGAYDETFVALDEVCAVIP